LFCLISPNSYADSGKIHLLSITDDIINPVTAEYITTAIDAAQKENAEALIIQLDTPGGLLTSTRGIVKAIMNAGVPVVVYVSPRGARAGSAGVFITMTGHIAAMAPSTNIGAAHPVSLNEKRPAGDTIKDIIEALRNDSGDNKKQKNKKEEKKPDADVMEKKVLNDTVAWAESIAEGRNRNKYWAVKAVTESVSITEKEALKDGVIDLIANDLTDLLDKIDGRSVKLSSGEKIVHTKGLEVVNIPMNLRAKTLSVVAHPNIILILMMLGFYGLLFEFTHPGIGFPGIAGAICIILAFFGLQVLPTSYAGLALIVLAVILFAAEVKVASYGLLTLGGVVSLFLGMLMLFPSPYEFMRVSIPVAGALALATLAVITFLTTIVVRISRRKTVTGAEGLVGETGEVKEWNGKSGKVFVHGEWWNAESSEELKKGDSIEVVKLEGMKLFVKK